MDVKAFVGYHQDPLGHRGGRFGDRYFWIPTGIWLVAWFKKRGEEQLTASFPGRKD